jgi:hypothetical protein
MTYGFVASGVASCKKPEFMMVSGASANADTVSQLDAV